ncbi:hypothetical protein FKM82_024794 [Ascaphus truei]
MTLAGPSPMSLALDTESGGLPPPLRAGLEVGETHDNYWQPALRRAYTSRRKIYSPISYQGYTLPQVESKGPHLDINLAAPSCR